MKVILVRDAYSEESTTRSQEAPEENSNNNAVSMVSTAENEHQNNMGTKEELYNIKVLQNAVIQGPELDMTNYEIERVDWDKVLTEHQQKIEEKERLSRKQKSNMKALPYIENAKPI